MSRLRDQTHLVNENAQETTCLCHYKKGRKTRLDDFTVYFSCYFCGQGISHCSFFVVFLFGFVLFWFGFVRTLYAIFLFNV